MKAKDLVRVAYRVGTGEDVMAPPEDKERETRVAFDPKTAMIVVLVLSLLCGLMIAWTMSRPVQVHALPVKTKTETVGESTVASGSEGESFTDRGESGSGAPAGDATPASGESAEEMNTGSDAGPQEDASGEVVVEEMTVTVYVSGHVADPGLVELPVESRVAAAIELVGGMTEEADPNALNLARKLVDGEHIVVPAPGDEIPEEPAADTGAETPTEGTEGHGDSSSTSSGSLVNINTADLAELISLPGIGPAIGQRILDWRELNGEFTSIDELMEVSGIGPATFANIEALVTI